MPDIPFRAFIARLAGPAALEPATILVAGRPVLVSFRRHAAARRFVLRLDRKGQGVVVTVPKRGSRKAALAFAEKSAEWIGTRLAARPEPASLQAGIEIPLRGGMVRLAASGQTRGLVSLEGNILNVPGAALHFGRRVADWLKSEALRDLRAASEHYAAAMDARFKRITVRDQTSRWGSCSADGSLSYSWRLILAPPYVLDYVAAHEVAHLVEMNHGPRFWRLVLRHCPSAKAAKAWLKANGHGLHRYA